MIVHAGEALIDFLPTLPQRRVPHLAPVCGGSPFNTTIATARLGVPNAFLAALSRDFYGDLLVETLGEEGVSLDLVVRSGQPTTLAFVSKNERGDARYAFYTTATADSSLAERDLPKLPEAINALQIGSLSLLFDPAGETILSTAERLSGRTVVSLDPNIRPMAVSTAEEEKLYRRRVARALSCATIVKVSDEDLQWIGHHDIHAGARELLSQGAQLVVVTRGADGAYATTASHSVELPALETTVRDTVGAGDSFHAALLSWLYHCDLLSIESIASLSRSHLERMTRFALAVAAHTCSREGADPPRLDDLPSEVRTWEGQDG